ncbi:MAG: hypothetical protein IJL60_11305 [Clostridiales bacterium]|nr:hypothetical protein [Clostridiales bacterium]
MKSNEINSNITLTAKEAETITGKLVAAGIDRELVERVIKVRIDEGCPKASNCIHDHGCDKYFRVGVAADCGTIGNCHHKHECGLYGPPKKSDIIKLKEALVEKGIDIKKIHPKAEKLFRG